MRDKAASVCNECEWDVQVQLVRLWSSAKSAVRTTIAISLRALSFLLDRSRPALDRREIEKHSFGVCVSKDQRH